MALNLSLMTAQSAKGLPEVAITLRTIDFERGITANNPALAAPAPGPNLKKNKDIFKYIIFLELQLPNLKKKTISAKSQVHYLVI